VASEWVSTSNGRHLSGRRKTDTSPEIALRKALHAAGGRFRLHRQIAKGCTPDIVLPSRRLAVFVDGCFWHGCPVHGRKKPWSGPNAELWAAKMRRNAERDQRSTHLAQEAGWEVVRVWECDVRDDAPGVAKGLLERPGLSPDRAHRRR
jgi:DNA mismatch endonuclease (patch repair protein)